MTDRELLNRLSKLGFPAFLPDEDWDINETLAEVVKSNDIRLCEGFPVLLINAVESYQFSFNEIQSFLDNNEQIGKYRFLVTLSLAIYKFYHLSFSWMNNKTGFPGKFEKNNIQSIRNKLTHNQPIEWGNLLFDPERIKNTFELYYEKKIEKDNIRNKRYNEFSLEYALSQIFSPKQKELFKKKLEGLPLTKTEQEYYSRRVKKKIIALANSELHNLSRKIIEQ